MNFSDEGYIIGLRRHGENSLIVTVLSAEHGKISGYARGAVGRKKLGIYQPGNAVSFNAVSRLEENMPGFYGVELVKAHAASVFGDEAKLAVLEAFCSLMSVCTVEKENLERLFSYIRGFMNALDCPNWLSKYSFVEFHLLEYLGIGLDLSCCAATGTTKNLAFVSPKSGKAVCYEAGLPYADKLFKFPDYIVAEKDAPNQADIADLLEMTGFFLKKNFFEVHGLKFPEKRGNLLNILQLKKEKQ